MADFQLNIDFNVLNHLGMGLYSNTPAVLTEIISNAWDADAELVSIDLDKGSGEVTIIDDGNGMTESEIVNKFLKVGYARRDSACGKSEVKSRQVMGRKGIGKLAMFSLANKIQVHTKKDGVCTAFEIDVGKLKGHIKAGTKYSATRITPFFDEEKGTKIILSDLTKSINRTESYLRKRLARRFSIIGAGDLFEVVLNGNPITMEDRDYLGNIQFLWEFGNSNGKVMEACKNKSKSDTLDNLVVYEENKYYVSGYIGTVELPAQLKTDSETSNNTITIMSNGRVFEENILSAFDSARMFTNYLVGEVEMNFLDDNELPDMATSSRQQLQQNDPRYKVVTEFMKASLNKIDKKWDEWRREIGSKEVEKETPILTSWLSELKSGEEKVARRLIGKLNTFRFGGSEEEQKETKKEVLKNTLVAFEKARINNNLSKLENVESIESSVFRDIFVSIDDIEASLFYDITSQRIKVIEHFAKITEDNELEKAVQEYLYKHLWLLDPSWERVTGSSIIEQTLTNELKQIEPDAIKGARIDIAYKTISGKHIIIEMKRPGVKVDIPALVEQGDKYVRATEQWYKNSPKSCPSYGVVPPIDVIFLLGKNEFPNRSEKYIQGQLESIGAKIFTYTDLITQSKQAYSEYLHGREDMSKFRKLIEEI
ncbi:High temperature protein G [Aeromonas encheleia]|uniref:BbrUII/HgiDII family restriction enzyme n=1 Tax=Aeromonas encheleia TaxID=73010 RepID=UPI000A0132AD|nr:ATP-binding protein [Aeromonas encheleia]VEG97013.1 High temperature protein G [Aeromonas encheleia]